MSNPTPHSELALAARRLDRAQQELTKALEELPVLARANKRITTARLRLAIDEISAAKDALEALSLSEAKDLSEAKES